MFTPIRFYEPRYHQSENNYYFGGPMMYPMMNQWDRMMFNVAKPFLISGMITNLSNTIADIIRGNKSGQNCNCGNSNYNMHSNNMYNYNDSLSAPLYPYVNLGNTHIEGKGGTENNNADTISKLESAYKEHGIKSIYKGDDGRYFAVTKDGKQLSALSLSDLSEEICKYINENKNVVRNPIFSAFVPQTFSKTQVYQVFQLYDFQQHLILRSWKMYRLYIHE